MRFLQQDSNKNIRTGMREQIRFPDWLHEIAAFRTYRSVDAPLAFTTETLSMQCQLLLIGLAIAMHKRSHPKTYRGFPHPKAVPRGFDSA